MKKSTILVPSLILLAAAGYSWILGSYVVVNNTPQPWISMLWLFTMTITTVYALMGLANINDLIKLTNNKRQGGIQP